MSGVIRQSPDLALPAHTHASRMDSLTVKTLSVSIGHTLIKGPSYVPHQEVTLHLPNLSLPAFVCSQTGLNQLSDYLP